MIRLRPERYDLNRPVVVTWLSSWTFGGKKSPLFSPSQKQHRNGPSFFVAMALAGAVVFHGPGHNKKMGSDGPWPTWQRGATSYTVDARSPKTSLVARNFRPSGVGFYLVWFQQRKRPSHHKKLHKRKRNVGFVTFLGLSWRWDSQNPCFCGLEICRNPNFSSTCTCHLLKYYQNSGICKIKTNSTARGGGGSFKNRKPIGEIGCRESPMIDKIDKKDK